MDMRLYLIADWEATGDAARYERVLHDVAPLLGARTELGLQVRVKNVSAAERTRVLQRACDILGPAAHLAFRNGPTHSVCRDGFCGPHWPEADIPAKPLPRGARMIAGASVHSPEALDRAERAGATFAVFGPVFDAGSKPVAGVGLDRLREVTRLARIPIFAVGGITPDRVADCIAAGAHGVAVVTGIMRAPDPVAAMDEYTAAILAALATPPAPGSGPGVGGESAAPPGTAQRDA